MLYRLPTSHNNLHRDERAGSINRGMALTQVKGLKGADPRQRLQQVKTLLSFSPLLMSHDGVPQLNGNWASTYY